VHLRLNAAGRLRAHAVVLAAMALVCFQAGRTVALLAHSYFRQDYTGQVIGALALGEQADRWTGTLDGVIADPMTFDSRGQLRPVAVEGPSAIQSQRRSCRNASAAGLTDPDGTHVAYVPVLASGSMVSAQSSGAARGTLCLTGGHRRLALPGSGRPRRAGAGVATCP
jgi:hypothetical protein